MNLFLKNTFTFFLYGLLLIRGGSFCKVRDGKTTFFSPITDLFINPDLDNDDLDGTFARKFEFFVY